LVTKIVKGARRAGVKYFSKVTASIVPDLMKIHFTPIIQRAVIRMQGEGKKILQLKHFPEVQPHHFRAIEYKDRKYVKKEAAAAEPAAAADVASSSASSSSSAAAAAPVAASVAVPAAAVSEEDEDEEVNADAYDDDEEDSDDDKEKSEMSLEDLLVAHASGEHTESSEQEKKKKKKRKPNTYEANLILSVSGAGKFITAIQSDLNTDASVSEEVRYMMAQMATEAFTHMIQAAQRYLESQSIGYEDEGKTLVRTSRSGLFVTLDGLLNSVYVTNPDLWKEYTNFAKIGPAGTRNRKLQGDEAAKIEEQTKTHLKLHKDKPAVIEDTVARQTVKRKNLDLSLLSAVEKTKEKYGTLKRRKTVPSKEEDGGSDNDDSAAAAAAPASSSSSSLSSSLSHIAAVAAYAARRAVQGTGAVAHLAPPTTDEDGDE
jgi:hypothetical protein